MKRFREINALLRRATLAVSVAAATLVSTGYALADDKVIVGALRFTSHAAGFIAYEKGYFKDEGLDVEFKFFQAAQPIAVAVAAGDADFGIAVRFPETIRGFRNRAAGAEPKTPIGRRKAPAGDHASEKAGLQGVKGLLVFLP